MHFLRAAVVGAIASLFATLLLLSTAYARADERAPQSFNIGPQSLAAALNEFARQSHEELLFAPEAVALKSSHGVRGRMEPQAALKLLLQDSGLSFSTTPAGTYLVGSPGGSSSGQAAANPANSTTDDSKEAGKKHSQDFRMAQVDQATSGPVAESKEEQKREVLDEVVVTGTHIHGVSELASPTSVYTRDDIELSGVGSISAFMQRLPDNFNGGAADNTLGSVTGGGNVVNTVGGTGVNLRGLGNDATLVLLNGERLAPGNTHGNFVDVSLVPANAIDRVEVVTDGASAIYGSDAVGGVVNYILRQHFDGSETNVRYGSVTSGGRQEIGVGQAVGHDWTTGSAILTYEYLDDSALTAADRSYTASAVQPFTLLPVQVRNSVVVNVQQDIQNNLALYADGGFSHRSTHFDSTTSFFSLGTPANVSAYNGKVGATIRLPRDTHLDVSAAFSESRSHLQQYFDGFLFSDEQTNSNISSVDAKLDGTVLATSAGAIRYAAGAQFRRESLDDSVVNGSAYRPHRNVYSEFLELRVPLLGPITGNNPQAGNPVLEVSLADRNEHYSDFGSTNNPQIGLIWRPAAGFKLRGTYGTSFKAPFLYDLNPVPFSTGAYPQLDPRTGNNTNTMVVFGGNPDLQPEKATTWTAGIDFVPEAGGIRASLTYYNTQFRDRIEDPEFNVSITTDALVDESILGPAIVQRNPPMSVIQYYASLPVFSNFYGIDIATIQALIDSRVRNLSRVSTDGLDLKTSYAHDFGAVGQLYSGLDANYILKFQYQFSSSAPTTDLLGTPYNPVNLRLRAHGTLVRGPWSGSMFLNYTNSYSDNRSSPEIPVASWTTLDASIGYRFGHDGTFPRDLSVTLGVLNALDRNPPYVANPTYGINYDGANANPLGRFIYLQLSYHP